MRDKIRNLIQQSKLKLKTLNKDLQQGQKLNDLRIERVDGNYFIWGQKIIDRGHNTTKVGQQKVFHKLCQHKFRKTKWQKIKKIHSQLKQIKMKSKFNRD